MIQNTEHRGCRSSDDNEQVYRGSNKYEGQSKKLSKEVIERSPSSERYDQKSSEVVKTKKKEEQNSSRPKPSWLLYPPSERVNFCEWVTLGNPGRYTTGKL